MSRPGFHVDVATTAIPAAIAQPPGGIQTSGFPAHSKFASAWANWLFNYLGQWTRELDQSCLRAVDVLSLDAPQLLQGSGTGFSLNLNTGLLNLQPNGGGAYVLFGRRVDLEATALTDKYPTGWSLPPNATVFAHAREETDAGGSSTGEILISTNSSEIGYQTIWTGDTDGTNLVSQSTLATTALQWLAPVDMTSRLTIVDPVDETALNIVASNTIASALLVTSLGGAVAIQASIGNTDGFGFGSATGSGAGTGYLCTMTGSPSGATGYWVLADGTTAGPAFRATHSGTGAGLLISHSGNAPGIDVEHTGSGASAVVIHGGASRALLAQGVASGLGIRGESGTTAGANAIQAVLLNNDGFGLLATTPVTASTTARAAKLTALNNAVGLETTSVNGPAVQASASGSTGVAIYMPGKASDPTNTGGGRVDYNTTTRTLVASDPDGAVYRDLWWSRGGNVVGATTGNVVSTIGGSWKIAATLALGGQDAPRRAGRTIILRFTCDIRNQVAVAQNWLNVRIIDLTDDPMGLTPIVVRSGAGTADNAGYLIETGLTDWARSIVQDARYTIPAAGDRSFQVQVAHAGTQIIRVRDAALIPLGLI